MGEWKGWDKIKYEEDLNPRFADEIASFPGGDKLWNCIQCGTCSGVCPLSTYMDYTPRKIVAMIRAGFKGEVLKSHTTWLCAWIGFLDLPDSQTEQIGNAGHQDDGRSGG